MLTYDALRTLVASERAAAKLLALPEDFFEQVQRYVKLKEQAAGGQLAPGSADTAALSDAGRAARAFGPTEGFIGRADELWELDAAKRALSDLLEVRERKLVAAALSFVRTGGQPGSLLPHELALFNALAAGIKEFRAVQSKLLEPEAAARAVVAFLQDVPAFAGSDLKSYGPYKAGDIATVPAEMAKALVAGGAAQELKA